jgi:hypothetical protein
VRVGTVPTLYYTKGEAPVSMKELKKKIGAKQYYVIQNTKKNSKEPSSKGNPEYWNLNGQAFTALT